ncbi:MAG: hypothetical protein AAF715_29415 [Myxococcota bacterium]
MDNDPETVRSRRIEAWPRTRRKKAETNGMLAAGQVRTAIVFDDVETIREAVEAVARDPNVDALRLDRAEGSLLLAKRRGAH